MSCGQEKNFPVIFPDRDCSELSKNYRFNDCFEKISHEREKKCFSVCLRQSLKVFGKAFTLPF